MCEPIFFMQVSPTDTVGGGYLCFMMFRYYWKMVESILSNFLFHAP